jgi:hypothetical protein
MQPSAAGIKTMSHMGQISQSALPTLRFGPSSRAFCRTRTAPPPYGPPSDCPTVSDLRPPISAFQPFNSSPPPDSILIVIVIRPLPPTSSILPPLKSEIVQRSKFNVRSSKSPPHFSFSAFQLSILHPHRPSRRLRPPLPMRRIIRWQ